MRRNEVRSETTRQINISTLLSRGLKCDAVGHDSTPL